MYPVFNTAIKTVLNNWTALQFAVQQQAGGKESAAVAEWMVGVLEQYFYENEDLDGEEVADYLATIMDQELNTLVEDESDLQVGECLCRLYQLCVAGQESAVMDELSKMPKCDLTACRVQEQDESEMDAPQLVADQMNELQLIDSGGDAVSETPPRELTELEKQQLQDEADGWTVIRKGNKKR